MQMLRNAKHLDASEFMFEDLTQRAVLVPEQRDEIIFPCAHGTIELERNDQAVRTSIHTQSPPYQGEEHHDDIKGEAERSDPAEERAADDIEARDDFWSIYVIFLIVITFKQE